ncbi:hypothetical protein JOD65_001177 [Nocardioides cavernae]|nr:hypothetical protein [Nocardioides cavernae]
MTHRGAVLFWAVAVVAWFMAGWLATQLPY